MVSPIRAHPFFNNLQISFEKWYRNVLLFSFLLPICRSLILHDRWKYDILQTTYRKAAAAENGRVAKLGPMDAPFRGQNALRGMFEAGWLLVSGRKSPALSASSFLPLHTGSYSVRCSVW